MTYRSVKVLFLYRNPSSHADDRFIPFSWTIFVLWVNIHFLWRQFSDLVWYDLTHIADLRYLGDDDASQVSIAQQTVARFERFWRDEFFGKRSNFIFFFVLLRE